MSAYLLKASRSSGKLKCGLTSRSASEVFYALREADHAPPCDSEMGGPCRARFKLREALALQRVFSLLGPAGDGLINALDLGAAPGGWTEVLASSPCVGKVIAIDPSSLDPAVIALDKVKHMQLLVQCAMPALQKDAAASGEFFQLVVCDMNFDTRDMAYIVSQVVPVMTSGAMLIATMKLPRLAGTNQIPKQTREAMNILERSGFMDFEVRHLLANTQWERTVIASYRSA